VSETSKGVPYSQKGQKSKRQVMPYRSHLKIYQKKVQTKIKKRDHCLESLKGFHIVKESKKAAKNLKGLNQTSLHHAQGIIETNFAYFA